MTPCNVFLPDVLQPMGGRMRTAGSSREMACSGTVERSQTSIVGAVLEIYLHTGLRVFPTAMGQSPNGEFNGVWAPYAPLSAFNPRALRLLLGPRNMERAILDQRPQRQTASNVYCCCATLSEGSLCRQFHERGNGAWTKHELTLLKSQLPDVQNSLHRFIGFCPGHLDCGIT